MKISKGRGSGFGVHPMAGAVCRGWGWVGWPGPGWGGGRRRRMVSDTLWMCVRSVQFLEVIRFVGANHCVRQQASRFFARATTAREEQMLGAGVCRGVVRGAVGQRALANM